MRIGEGGLDNADSSSSFGRRGASVKDVAAAAGVSLGTVSNVLNRPDRVSAATRERVERAMVDLGFVRNESARGTARRAEPARSPTSCSTPATPSSPTSPRASSWPPRPPTLSLFICNSDNRAAREHTHLAHLQQQRVQGILITPVDPEAPGARRDRPARHAVVIVDRTRQDDSFCSVAVDDVLGGRLAVEHLIDRGHTRVAFIGGPQLDRPGRGPLPGCPQGLGRGRTARRRPGCDPTASLTVAEGQDGRRAAGRDARQAASDRSVLRQ